VVVVRRGRTVLASGSGTGVFKLGLTRRAKFLLRRARSLQAVAVAEAPGGTKRTLTITFKR
jgi:hypothetical protein